VAAGERVWFMKKHIFEINTELLDDDRSELLQKFINEDRAHVPVTGVRLLLDIDD
jgi:hypothetical protein